MAQTNLPQLQLHQVQAVRRQKGLTLIEIMIVVVILGMLALAIIPNITGRTDQAAVARAKSDIQSLSAQLELFKTDNFRYPSGDEGLEALVQQPPNVKNYPKKWILLFRNAWISLSLRSPLRWVR